MELNRRAFLQLASASTVIAGAMPSRFFAAVATDEPDFAVRGLEFSGTGIWQWKTIDRALDLMERLDFNTLLVHQNDLPDFLVWPRAYFPDDFMYARNPVRTVLTCNGRNHIREVVRRARHRNIQVYLEAKEIGYPDGLIELHPELMEIKGVVCPTHPFWWPFERERYAEVLKEIPDLAGVMFSCGTRESKVSLAAHNCTCARCRSYDASEWYANLIRAVHAPLKAAGKKLVVRDFAYRRTDQDLVVNACAKVSPEIVVSLKNTPHDFYPVFPDNPRIGNAGGNPQWAEFDAMGRFFGLGIFPTSVIEHMQGRLHRCKEKGVTGVWFRADIEFVSDSSVFNSPNIVNLFGASLLSRSVGQDLDAAYRAWLAYGLSDPLQTESEQGEPVPMPPQAIARFRDFMRASWAVMEKTVYVRGLVFTDGTGQFPDSVDRAFDNMLVLHGRDDWEPGASRRIDPTEENLRTIFAEKEQAESEVERLPNILQLDQTPMPAEMRASLQAVLELYQHYVRGFRHCTVACFTVRKAETDGRAADINAVERALDRLIAYREDSARLLNNRRVPYFVQRLFALEPLDRLAIDIERKLAEFRVPHGAPAART